MSDPKQQSMLAYVSGTRWVLPAIVLLATFLRLHDIGHHSFWLDELFSLKFASQGLADLFREVARFDNHPPTYYLLLHFWIGIFGDSEVSLRVPSAFFSVLSVYFTFRIGELLFDRQVSLIAALLLALSGFSIYYAQEARMYSLLALSSVLSAYFLLQYLEQPTPRRVFNYVWASTLLVYTHLYGLFIILAENIYVLMLLYHSGNRVSGMSLRKWIAIQGSIVLLSLPWFVLLINRIVNLTQDGFWAHIPTVGSLIWTFVTFSGPHIGLALWIVLMIWGVLSGLQGKMVLSSPLFDKDRDQSAGWPVLLLLLLIFTPILLPYLISKITTPIYIIRCTIAGHFAFFLLVANGIASLRWPGLRAMGLVLVLALSMKPLLSAGYVHNDATDFREVVEYLALKAGNGDRIILCGSHLNWPFRYYAKQRGLSSEIVKFDGSKTVPYLSSKQKGWYVGLTERKGECEPALHALEGKYTQLKIGGVSATNIKVAAFINNQ